MNISDTPEYKCWRNLIRRCHNPNSKDWNHYGARGIKVCQRWRNNFNHFIRDVGERPSNDHSIERLDPAQGYNPDNCVWATQKEQARNKTTTHRITINGQEICAKDYCKKINLKYSTFTMRIKKGWSLYKALTTPVKTKKNSQ